MLYLSCKRPINPMCSSLFFNQYYDYIIDTIYLIYMYTFWTENYNTSCGLRVAWRQAKRDLSRST